jgi:hypothetical protein
MDSGQFLTIDHPLSLKKKNSAADIRFRRPEKGDLPC